MLFIMQSKKSEDSAETKFSVESISQTAEQETARTFVKTPSGYTLDPSYFYNENVPGWGKHIESERPYLIAKPMDGLNIYGLIMENNKEKIIIEHGGIADEFDAELFGRFRESVSNFYTADFDKDNNIEIASLRYANGGSFCRVYELVIYKEKDGHYERFVFDSAAFNAENIYYEQNNDKQTISFFAQGKKLDYDISPIYVEEYGINVKTDQVNDFVIDGDEITYIVSPMLQGTCNEFPINISFKLNFSNGEFLCEDVKITV